MPHRRLLSLLAVVLLLTGCSRDAAMTGPEQGDADFLRAQDLKQRGLKTEALAAYLKVIARRGELAPESYLDAGLIYFQDIKDPFKGWYYMQQYLALQPNSPRREEVRQQVMAAEREALLQRLAQSQFGGGELVQLQEQVDQLTRENLRLEAELKRLREAPDTTLTRSEFLLTPPAGAATPIAIGPEAGGPAASGPINVNPPGASSSPAITFSLPGAAPSAEATRGAAAASRGSPAQKGAAPAAKSAAPAAAARTYAVKAGDTLSAIARSHYNSDASAARLNALRQANRDVLRNGDNLSPGMTLRIP